MWTIQEVKARGKAAFHWNPWRCVLAALVLTAILAGRGGSARNGAQRAGEEAGSYAYAAFETLQAVRDGAAAVPTAVRDTVSAVPAAFRGILTPFSLIAGLVAAISALLASILVELFLVAPLEVGCRRFFLENSRTAALSLPYERASLWELLYAFRTNYLNSVFTLFLRNLYLFLWALLLVIPAIVKSYSYRMVPYLLAEFPDMEASAVIALSREMMDGEKMNAFMLDLSFIFWALLALFTGGIAGVVYVNPYKAATDAELYNVLRASYAARDSRAF